MSALKKTMIAAAFVAQTVGVPALAEVPAITGSPVIVAPALLEWPSDVPLTPADLTEPTSNRLEDLHGVLGDCTTVDLVYSTAGNYHMALRDLWQTILLPSAGDAIKSWYYSTSPPIAPEQIANQHLGFGNFSLDCVPSVAGGPKALMTSLAAMGVSEGSPVPIVRNRGNVILVPKGNPKHIKTIWDLGKRHVRVVTPNPYTEAGSFDNYSGSIYNIAANDPNPPAHMTAEMLFNRIFNGNKQHNKWVSGKRIHHREVPWAISSGNADAGLMFYHLALYAQRTFPDKFDIVPLGGTVEDPQPVAGNKIATMNIVRIKGEASNTGAWNDRQLEARERLIDAFLSEEFREILESHGMQKP